MAGIGSDDGATEAGATEAGRRRREFIRAHHPDRGGDADTFMAGLRLTAFHEVKQSVEELYLKLSHGQVM